jgi:hypothetical protein
MEKENAYRTLFYRFAQRDDKFGEEWIEEFEDKIIEEGEVVATHSWESDNPGSGAGMTLIYRFQGLFFTSTDFGFDGPYEGLAKLPKLWACSPSRTPQREFGSISGSPPIQELVRTTMHSDKKDRNFPAIRLTETAKIDSPTELHCLKLKELAERLDQLHSFTKGQFVKWKAGLKNRKFPDYGEPEIVTDVLPSAIFDPGEATSGSPYFQEPLTFVLGIYKDDEFLEFRLDSRRFEPFD